MRYRPLFRPALWIVTWLLLLTILPAYANVTMDPGKAVPYSSTVPAPVPIVLADGSQFLWGADESIYGDLNADGDTLDEVVQLYEAATSTSSNLGLATGDLADAAFTGGLAMVYVSESDQNGVDLNGDGDAQDQVLHLISSSGTVTNTGLSGPSTPQRVGDWIAVSVYEGNQGQQDRNNDGDTLDWIMALYRISTGTIRPLDTSVSGHVLLGNRALAWVQRESDEGTDLNGDGDQDDLVIATHHLNSNVTRVFPFAVKSIGGVQDDRVKQFFGNRLGILVHEGDQGADVNGDGDLDDSILAIVDARTGARFTTQFAAGELVQPRNGRLIVFADEADMGRGVDLNGDGDHVDTKVAVAVRTLDGAAKLLGLASATALDRAGRYTLLEAYEAASRADWNRDQDMLDKAVHVYDHATNSLRTIPLAMTRWYLGAARMDGSDVVVAVSESDHGATDLNGDGSATDVILHKFSLSSGQLKNFGQHAGWVNEVRDGHVSYIVEEWVLGTSGIDVNQDGAIGDRVVRLIDLSNGSITETRAAVVQTVAMWPSINHTSIGVWVAARELSHGCDLDGDGDPLDYVVQLGRH